MYLQVHKFMLNHRLKQLGEKHRIGTLEELQDRLLVLQLHDASEVNEEDHEYAEEGNEDSDEPEEEEDGEQEVKEYEWKDYSAKGLQTLLSQQPDFADEKCMLELELKARGDLCLFLPKFHCELNMIELIWGRSKFYVRRAEHPDKGSLRALVGGPGGQPPGLIWSSFDPLNLPLTLVWKYAAKCRDFIRLYHKEVSTGIIHKVRKNYKSHRRVFEFNKETDLDAFNSVPWKELDVELVQNHENPE